MKKNRNPERTKTLKEKGKIPFRYRFFLGGASFFLALMILVTGVAFAFRETIDLYLSGSRTNVSKEAKEEAAYNSRRLAAQIEAEGAVLLKNENNTLPLSEEITRVNVFGWASTQWLGSGSGSGRVEKVDLDLLGALKEAGIAYNEELTRMYQDFQPKRQKTSTLESWPEESCRLYEPDITDTEYYTEDLLKNAKEYSDTAIMVVGRLSGESNDCPQVQYKKVKKNGQLLRDKRRSYLDLSTEEEGILRYLGENYKNVILLLNTGNVMTLGAIDLMPGIGACVMAGMTGQYSAEALPDLLWGKITPSGRTADTWAYNFRTAASYANAGADGVGSYENGEGLYPFDGTKSGNVGESFKYDQVSYVDYAEGIYVGYKWYETADAQDYWDKYYNLHGRGYQAVVQYPFGYGLSYTTFDWKVVNAPGKREKITADGSYKITVEVTNTGERAGKEVVQLYYAPPYEAGEIEKSAVVLADYAKTGELQPGEKEEVTLSVKARDMASYDFNDSNQNGFAGYELDPGTYVLSLRKNAHETADIPNAQISLKLAENIQYPTDEITGAVVSNKMTGKDAVDGVGIDGSDSGQKISYMSRSDFDTTFPKEPVKTRKLSEKAAELNLYTQEKADEFGQSFLEQSESQSKNDVAFGKKQGLYIEKNGTVTKLGYELGADYDDPKWDEVLNQLTEKETEELFLHGYVKTEELENIGKPLAREADGPAQIGSFNQNPTGTGFPNAGVMAQSWNTELSRDMGRAVAKEAGQFGYSGWYAPAVNIHRSPFDGRNYEYYSEDSFLSGKMCGAAVSGSMDMGVYCYVKHLICNDQESGIYRDGVYTWMTEQALRETYLKPFQMIVQDNGATGLMSSYNRIGAVWAGGSKGLLTSILRDEWGFKGAVLTDYSDHHKYMNGDQALAAGGTLWMDGFMNDGSFAFKNEENKAAYDQALRQSAKDVIYMYLNARVRNQAYAEEMDDWSLLKPEIKAPFPLWAAGLAAVDLLAIGNFVFAVNIWKKRKRELLKDHEN